MCRQSVAFEACALFALFALAATSAGCGGSRLPQTRGVDGRAYVESGSGLGDVVLKPSLCEGIDVTAEAKTLEEAHFINFLKSRGLPARLERARADLVYADLQLNPETDEWVRLRIATLATPAQAGEELHRAVREHGTGSWGVHRSNLAVLAPRGSLDAILAFNAKTKLACWGVLTVAGRQDAYVVPGAYREY
jgi:hypothetical protein